MSGRLPRCVIDSPLSALDSPLPAAERFHRPYLVVCQADRFSPSRYLGL